jgi:hypothetical protein
MHGTIARKISAIFLILTIATSYSSIDPHWHTYASEHPVELCTLGAAAVWIIGKISYEFYLNCMWPTETVIEHCRTTYTNVYAEIRRHYNNYTIDAQSSDWDLKESINHIKTHYQFMAYHQQIMQAIFQLIKHNTTITHELELINKQKKRVTNNNSQASILIMEELKQLEIKGKALQEYIAKILNMLSTLKNRIILFKEYNDDYHNWSYEKQKKIRANNK